MKQSYFKKKNLYGKQRGYKSVESAASLNHDAVCLMHTFGETTPSVRNHGYYELNEVN